MPSRWRVRPNDIGDDRLADRVAVLHNRWKAREIAPGRIGAVTLILIAVGVRGTFPPDWARL